MLSEILQKNHIDFTGAVENIDFKPYKAAVMVKLFLPSTEGSPLMVAVTVTKDDSPKQGEYFDPEYKEYNARLYVAKDFQGFYEWMENIIAKGDSHE